MKQNPQEGTGDPNEDKRKYFNAFLVLQLRAKNRCNRNIITHTNGELQTTKKDI